MMEELIKYIEHFVKLDNESKNALYDLTTFETYPKKAFIQESGKHCNKIWYLKKGLVRKFYLQDDKENTVWIHSENNFFTSLQSYANNTLSDEFLQACEDIEAISISKSNSEKLSKYPQFIVFTNELMRQEFATIDKHTKAFNSLDARGKYNYLLSIAPEIIQRSKLSYIASILGITQETLSRIRKN